MCDKVRPARGLHRLTRDKIRPAQPLLQCFREKTRPARHKPPILGYFSCAGRTFSRSRPPSDQAGRTLYRTRGRCRYKTLPAHTPSEPRYKTLPAHWPGGPNRYKTLPARSLGEPNRYKTLPARSLGEPNRYKTLPARHKTAILDRFSHAGRILSRSGNKQTTQGEESHAPTPRLTPATRTSPNFARNSMT